MKKGIFVFMLLAKSFTGICQQTFQDGSGNTNFSLSSKEGATGYVFYNTTDKSATLGYNHKHSHKIVGGYDIPWLKADWIAGIDFKVKTKDGIGNVLKDDAFNPGITAGLNMGIFKDDFLGNGHYNTIFFRPQISYTQYDMIATEQPAYELNKVKKWEASALLNYNIQLNCKRVHADGSSSLSYFFIFLQSGFKQLNNYDDLDDGQITSTLSQITNKSIETVKTGKLGTLTSSNTLPLNLDIAWTPSILKNNKIGFNAYYRTNFFREINTTYGGLGIYLADPDNPSKISGGIGWQFNDMYNKLKKETDALSRSSVFFYIGYAIGPK